MITGLIIAGAVCVYFVGAGFMAYLTGRRGVDYSDAFFFIVAWPVALPIVALSHLYWLGERDRS